MKKIFLVFVVLFAVFIHVNKADASTLESDYVNLLDVSNLKYDEGSQTIGSIDYIYLEPGVNYTFIATRYFFGSACEESISKLIGKNLGVIFKDEAGQSLTISTMLRLDTSRLYYVTLNSAVGGYILFTDLLVKDRTLDNLEVEQYIFYEGTRYNFKGFKKSLDIDSSYTKAEEEMSIFTDYDNPISVDTIKNNLVVYDANDGLLTNDYLTVIDNYSNNIQVGEHEVIFQAKDKKNNLRQLKVSINVLDRTAPVISGVAEIPWNMSKPCPTITDLKEYLSITDNADSNLTVDDIYISSSSLSSYKVGVENTYIVTFAAEDASKNTGYYQALLSTVDTESPILEVKDLTYKLSEAGEYLFRDLYQQVIVSISDNSGQYSLSYTISEVYGNGGFSGEFNVILKATDAAGNSTTKTAKVTVIDDFAPEIYIKSFLLETSTDNPYSTSTLKAEIRHRLDARGIIYDEVNLISSNYFSNEKNVGTYEVKYAYTYNNKTNYEIATINVVEAESFNYAWLCLLLIPAAGISGLLFVKKRKKRLD